MLRRKARCSPGRRLAIRLGKEAGCGTGSGKPAARAPPPSRQWVGSRVLARTHAGALVSDRMRECSFVRGRRRGRAGTGREEAAGAIVQFGACHCPAGRGAHSRQLPCSPSSFTGRKNPLLGLVTPYFGLRSVRLGFYFVWLFLFSLPSFLCFSRRG